MSQQEDILSESQSQSQGYQDSEDDVSSVESDYTPEWEDGTSKKVKYRVITEEKRKNLIELVHDQNVNIVKAAKKLGIKYSTAKTIYSVFLKEGRVVSKLKRGAKTKKPKAEPKKQKPAKKAKDSDLGAEVAPQRRTRNAEKKLQSPYVEQVEVEPVNPKKASTDQYEPPLSKRTKIVGKLQGEETIQSQPVKIEPKELNIPTKVEDMEYNPTIQNQLLLAKLNSLQAFQRSYMTQPPAFQWITNSQPKGLPQNFGISSPNIGLSGLNPLNFQMLQNMWFQQGLINQFQHKY